MTKLLKNTAWAIKWAAILSLVGLLGYFCPLGGSEIADSLFGDKNDDDEG